MLLASAVCAAYAEPVTFWTFQAAHRKFMESAAERWNETYPDRPLELQAETLGYDDLHNNLLISLQTGTGAPDIVDIEIAMYANFITGDEQYIPLLPLNDIIEPEKDHFIMGRFDNYANHGNYYGVNYHVGAIAMPLWYLNRFTDYMPDLKGKMAVRTMPVWSEGGANSCGLGGTGTSVTNQAKDPQLCKDFLYFAKLSHEGAVKTWTELGFDPLRNDVYDDPEMTAPNVFTDYFGDDVYQVINDTAASIASLSTSNPLYPEALTLVQKTVMFEVLSEQSKTPEESLKYAADQLRARQ